MSWLSSARGEVLQRVGGRDVAGLHVGGEWFAAVHPDDRPRAELAWSDAVGRRRPFEHRARLIRRFGGYTAVRIRAEEEAGRWLVLAEPLAAAGLPEVRSEAEAVQQVLVETFEGILLVLDQDSVLHWSHPSWDAYRPRTDAGPGTRGWWAAMHPEDVADAADWGRALASGRPVGGLRVRMRRRDGQLVRFLLQGRRMAPDRWAIVGRPEPDHDGADAQAAALAKQVHGLRQPLAPLQTGLDILQRGPEAAVSAEVQTTMRRALGALVRRVDELLDTQRLTGPARLKRQPLAARDLVYEGLAAGAEHVGRLDVDIDDDLVVEVDGPRMVRVVAALLEAASGAPSVRVQSRQIEANWQLTVRVDPGGGPPPTGALLAWSEAVAGAHGGGLSVEADGDGWKAAVTLPVRVAPDRAGPAAGAVPKVLVVDDDADAARLLEVAVQALGCRTASAFDGRAACEQAEAFRPDLVLADLDLPELDGHGFASWVRARSWGHEVVLIAVSGLASPTATEQALAAGFDLHVTKPIDLEHVAALLGRGVPEGS